MVNQPTGSARGLYGGGSEHEREGSREGQGSAITLKDLPQKSELVAGQISLSLFLHTYLMVSFTLQ